VSATLRDVDRQAVYDVEDAAFAGTIYAEPVGFDEAAALVVDFCSHSWWATLGLPVPGVRRTRVDARTSYVAHRDGGPVVHLSPDGCAVSVVAHELAHVLGEHGAGGAGSGHGPGFRWAAVALAGALMGAVAGERLAAGFAAAGLPLGRPGLALPAPPRFGFWAAWRAERLRGAAVRGPGVPIVL
jgi:hypothetical protein